MEHDIPMSNYMIDIQLACSLTNIVDPISSELLE